MQLRLPTEMGGQGGGTNPEQLFAVGYAACFEGALGVVGRREKAEVGDASIDSKVSLSPTENKASTVAVELDVTLPQVDGPRGGQADRRRRARGLPVLERDPRQHRGHADRERAARLIRCSSVLGLPAAQHPLPVRSSSTVASARCHAGWRPW